MKQRILELVKNIVIALLLCNILVLVLLALPGNLSGFSDIADLFSDYARLPVGEDVTAAEGTRADLALPLVVSVNRSAGRTTIRRDETAVRQAYETLGGYLSDALSSAEGETALTDLPDLSEKNGVLFTYGGTMPAQVLTSWLSGAESGVDGAYTSYLVTCESGSVYLYAVEGALCMRYETAVSADALLQDLSEYTPDGSTLAGYRNDGAVHPLTLWESDVKLPAYSAVNPLWEEYASELAVALDFNPYGAGTYTEANGSVVYTEGPRALTISPEGRVDFAAAEENYTRFTAQTDTPAALAELTKQLLDLVLANTTEEGYLQLCSVRRENGETVLTFCWCLDGTPVFPACAEAVYSGTTLQRLTCLLRAYRKQTGTLTAMPIAQAAAVAEKGAMLLPAYRVPASGILSLGWKEVR